MEAIYDFINQYEGEQQAILKYFHHYLYKQTGLILKIRYKIPFYFNRSWICYLNPIRKTATTLDGIELAFTRGNELSNTQDLLQSNGRKQIKGITFNKIKEIPTKAIEEIIQEAILLDEQIPYKSKNSKQP